MTTKITITVNAQSREEYRKMLIEEFLKESPGSSSTVSEYLYYVDEDSSTGNKIYLKRPAQLNKGMDFEVRVENTQFRYGKHGNKIATGNRPKHEDITKALKEKKTEDPDEFKKLKGLLEKTYTCQPINQSEYQQFTFTKGISVELIFKVLKWLFVEQDITYWNRSGREMFYTDISKMWK